jgi:hypothetical protein
LKARKTSSEKLNFIIAVCAILISAASFYATYLQADAANKQVKAMTLPLLQFGSGNWDDEEKQNKLTFSFNNVGAGAAMIKNVKFIYQDKTYSSFELFLEACCDPLYGQFLKIAKTSQKNEGVKSAETIGFPKTSPLENTALIGENKFFQMVLTKYNEGFWLKLNNERFDLKTEVCFCSLLDDCYVSRANGIAKSVKQCL